MTSPTIVPVVLSGGSGTRLWPASRHETPKQLEALVSDRTMLGATLDRLDGLDGAGPAVVVCNTDHVAAVRREVRGGTHGDATVVLEPVGRNTAPAVAVAAMVVDDDPVLLVMPADHVIADIAEFQRVATLGARVAADGGLVTFGIVPTFPATGYGYIRAEGEGEVRRVASFVEKPDEETAAGFLASGEYLWNSGMFMFRASRYLDELARFAPDMVEAARRAVDAGTRPADGVLRLDADAFAASPSDSIDYAVMERTDRAMVLSLSAGWSDVGSWASLHEIADGDDAGTVTIGDVLAVDVTDSYLRSDGPLLAVLGLSGIVVIATPDAVLVADEGRVEEVKTIVEELRDRGRPQARAGARRAHEWGSSLVLDRTTDGVVTRYTLDTGETVTAVPGTWVVLAGAGKRSGGGSDALTPGATFTVGDEPVTIEAGGDGPLILVAVTRENPGV
jgi:mannose-1-phosphate guanylyltransferase/mannose-6-phosphate isomerase